MGRMSKRDEELVMRVVNKSWQIVEDMLTKSGYSKEKKEMVALEVAKRTAPKNIDLTSGGDKIQSPIYGGESTVSIQGHPGNSENISTT